MTRSASPGRALGGREVHAGDGPGLLRGDGVRPDGRLLREEPDGLRLTYDPAQGVDRYFDWQRLLEQAVFPMRAGTSSTFQPCDWQAGAGLAARTTIEPAPVVVLEALYSARPDGGSRSTPGAGSSPTPAS